MLKETCKESKIDKTTVLDMKYIAFVKKRTTLRKYYYMRKTNTNGNGKKTNIVNLTA